MTNSKCQWLLTGDVPQCDGSPLPRLDVLRLPLSMLACLRKVGRNSLVFIRAFKMVTLLWVRGCQSRDFDPRAHVVYFLGDCVFSLGPGCEVNGVTMAQCGK